MFDNINCEEYVMSPDDANELDKFKFWFDYGYDLSQINDENRIEDKKTNINLLEERIEYFYQRAEKDWEYIINRPVWIQILQEKAGRKDVDIVRLRGEYRRTRDFFLNNPWIFVSKKVPDWACQRVVEDNLDNIMGEGIQQKEELSQIKNKIKQLDEEVQFDIEFSISNVGYFQQKAILLERQMLFLKQNLEYDEHNLDSLYKDDEEEFFCQPDNVRKNNYPDDNWSDEQLTMLISTTENGFGVFAAEKILNQRRQEELIRRQKKLSTTKVSGMQDVINLSNYAYRTKSLDKQVEDDSIRLEDQTEKRRILDLVKEDDQYVYIPGEKVWYYKGTPTSNPDKVDFGFSELKLVPKRYKFDAMYNIAYDSFTGRIGVNHLQIEDHIDKINCNFEEEYLQTMSV